MCCKTDLHVHNQNRSHFPEPSSSQEISKNQKYNNSSIVTGTLQSPCPVNRENVCIQFLKFTSQPSIGNISVLQPQHQERKRIHPRMEQSRNLDCSSKLYALPASTALLVLLTLRSSRGDNVTSQSHLVHFFLLEFVYGTCSIICLPYAGKAAGLNRAVPFPNHLFKSKSLCSCRYCQCSCSRSKLA